MHNALIIRKENPNVPESSDVALAVGCGYNTNRPSRAIALAEAVNFEQNKKSHEGAIFVIPILIASFTLIYLSVFAVHLWLCISWQKLWAVTLQNKGLLTEI